MTESDVWKPWAQEREDVSRGRQAWQVKTNEGFANQILHPSQPQLAISEPPPSSPTCHPCQKLPPAMSGLVLLGVSALLGLGTGAPLCLSRQLRMQGDYILGGLFPLGSVEDTGLGNRTQPNTTVCTR